MTAPKLHFKEFDEDWSKITLGDYSETITSGSRDWAQYYSDSGDKFIRMTNLVRDGIHLDLSDLKFVKLPDDSNEGKRTNLKSGDILISITAELGKLGWIPDGLGTAYINQHTALVRMKEICDSKFIAYGLSTEKYNNKLNSLNDSGAKAGLNLGTIRNFEVIIPSKKEQTKIASFLSEVDKKISQLTQKQQLLSQYKQGMMQKLFSQQIRFKADDGSEFEEWNDIQLKDISHRITRKNKELNQNALTISAQLGLINQQEYFSKQIASRDLSKYYLLHKGEYAYNKSYSAGYPMGAIKRLKLYDKGVVSTLYICFSLNEYINSDYCEQFVESGLLVPELEKIAQEGARNHGLLNISLQEFFEVDLKIPSLDEQAKIANFLSAIDQKIEVTSQQIEQAKQWKKGLLQQMFV